MVFLSKSEYGRRAEFSYNACIPNISGKLFVNKDFKNSERQNFIIFILLVIHIYIEWSTQFFLSMLYLLISPMHKSLVGSWKKRHAFLMSIFKLLIERLKSKLEIHFPSRGQEEVGEGLIFASMKSWRQGKV